MVSKNVFYLFLPLVAAILIQFKLNNTCRSYSGYFNIFFSNDCYYNPDLDDDIFEIIRRHVGVSETHEVQTEDGYLLGLFRIPKENPKGVILLQHPIYFDARVWIGQFNESVAFLFWRAGYDVWLGNSRGTLYSKKHVTLKSTERAFWNFSFHEMGYYDHPATIGYIKNKTKSKITYLGLSMGGTTGLIYASTKSEDAARSIKLMILLAPVSHQSRGGTSAKYIVLPYFFIHNIFNLDNLSTTLREDSFSLKFLKLLLIFFPCKKCIVYVECLLSGWTPDETDPNLINMLIKIFGSEGSFKIMSHFHQIYMAGGKFRMYDYGFEENLDLYGQKEPPPYPLRNINLPVFTMYGQNDSFICPRDIDVLFADLPEKSKLYGKLMVEGFSHSGFIVGRHRNEKVYRKILELLERIG